MTAPNVPEPARAADCVVTPFTLRIGTLVRNGGRIFRVTGEGGNATYFHCAFEYLGTEQEWALNDGSDDAQK